MKKCPDHNKPFSAKSPNAQGNYWHVIDFAKHEFCSKTKAEYDAIPQDDDAWLNKKEDDEVIAGKCRTLFIRSRIIKQGLTPLDEAEQEALKQLVAIAMGVSK